MYKPNYFMHYLYMFRHIGFIFRTANILNRLSADCVGASSVNMFKNKIDMYLRRAWYI